MGWTARTKRRWQATRQAIAGAIWWLRYRIVTRRRLLKRVHDERRGRLAERRAAAYRHAAFVREHERQLTTEREERKRVTDKYVDAAMQAERHADRAKQLEDELTTAERDASRLQGKIDVMEDQLRLLSAWQEKWQQRMEAEAAISATRKVAAELGRISHEDSE